ncbi:MAG: DNA-3-methyladenine glycosylase I [Bdellovibrionota bacterium]
MAKKSNRKRCPWSETHELFIPYHDEEWGKPVHDDRLLFEMLNLEGAQAGLSWLTVLKKRSSYKKAFDNFNAKKIITYKAAKKKELLNNEGIIRNRLKVDAVIANANAYLAVQKEFKSFDKFIWTFVGGKPIPFSKRSEAIKVSEVMSKDLKKRGFKFVGPTICFAYMQATGMVNDHSPECYLYKK